MKSWIVAGIEYSPQEVMEAHQFLYYCGGAPGLEGITNVWTDYRYDMWCKSHGLEGIGGSNRESDYTPKVKALAIAMFRNLNDFLPERFLSENGSKDRDGEGAEVFQPAGAEKETLK